MIVDNEITRSDFEKSLKLQGLESFNSDQVSAWLNDNKKLIEKSKVEELDELEKSALDEFKVNAGSLKKVIVVEDNLEKSIVFVRPQQVDWDRDENGEILKSRAGTYKDTPENRKLGRVGQKFGGKKEAGDKEKEKPLNVLNVDESIAKDFYEGKISLREAAKEFKESGSTNFIDESYAKKKIEKYSDKYSKGEEKKVEHDHNLKESSVVRFDGQRHVVVSINGNMVRLSGKADPVHITKIYNLKGEPVIN